MTSSPGVSPMLVCLSGSLKGCTLTPAGERILLGTDPECAIRFPPSDQRPVAPKHAEIVRDEEGWLLRALVEEPLIVNETPVRKARLFQNDLFRLGPRGPLLRFHARSQGDTTKSFRQILLDSAAFSREDLSRRNTATRAKTFAREVFREARDHGSWRLKIGVLLAGIFLLTALGLGVWQTIRSADQDERLSAAASERARLLEQQRVSEERLRAAEEYNQRILAELGLEREQREQLARTLNDLLASQDEDQSRIRDLLERSAAVDTEVGRLRSEVEAAPSINKQYAGGVAMIAVGVSFFHENSGRYLRRISEADMVKRGSGITIGGEGPKVMEWVTGSGFLIDDQGLLLSNRHVIDPWWNNEQFGRGVLTMGFRPVRTTFLAFFPGRKDPIELIRVGSAEKADIAFARLKEIPTDPALPVLKLKGESKGLAQGDQALLLGFPEGVQGLVNKLEDERTKELRSLSLSDVGGLLRAIAERDGIRPSMTAGVISNITSESLVYSAVTTSGGSGGPLFSSDGFVIGVNTAVSREFTGHNFGTRIEAAQAVLLANPLLEALGDALEIAVKEADEKAENARQKKTDEEPDEDGDGEPAKTADPPPAR